MFVYVVTCSVNGKVYVGKTADPDKRWGQHVRAALGGKHGALYAAIREDGPGAFSYAIAQRCESEEESLRAEREWIERLGATDREKGYNRTRGGNGPPSGKAWKSHLPGRSAKDLAAEFWSLYSSGLSVRSIGDRFGFSGTHVFRTLRRHGYTVRDLSQSHLGCKLRSAPIDSGQVVALYRSGLTLADIGARFRCSAKHVQRVLQLAGVDRRRGVAARRQSLAPGTALDPAPSAE